MGVPGVPPAKPEVEEVLETKLSNMFSSSLALSLLFFGLASAFELEDSLLEYDESESDPRLFFSNFTSGLVAINTTLLTYGAIIVLGGAAIGLLLYLLATTCPNTRYANAYGQSYGQNSGYSSYNRRMFTDSKSVFNFDLLGLVNKAVEVYQQLNGEED